MKENKQLTEQELDQVSGGKNRWERRYDREQRRAKRREEREHKKTCPDGTRTPDCPNPVPAVEEAIDIL